MAKLIRRPDIWISLLIFLLMIPAERMELFSAIENWLLGNRHIVRLNTLEPEKTQFAYDKIVIVDTEEQFFDEYGSWPLKRADIAKLITNIKRLGAKVKEVSLPNTRFSVAAYYVIAPAEASSNLSRFDGVRFGYRADKISNLEDMYIKSRTFGFGEEVKRRILVGTFPMH